MMKLQAIGVLGVLVLTTACGRGKVDVVERGSSNPGNPATPIVSVETSTDQPTITVANWEETQQLVAQNPGKVVILDLWATW